MGNWDYRDERLDQRKKDQWNSMDKTVVGKESCNTDSLQKLDLIESGGFERVAKVQDLMVCTANCL